MIMLKTKTPTLRAYCHILKNQILSRAFAYKKREFEYPKEVDSNFISTKEYDSLTLKKPINQKQTKEEHENEEDEENEIYYKVNVDYLKEVEARVVQYINEYLDDYIVDIDKLDLNTSFKDLDIDSLLQTEVVIFVENCLGVRFGDSEALEIQNLYDLVLLSHRYYSEKKNKQALQVIKNKEIEARTRFNKKFNIKF